MEESPARSTKSPQGDGKGWCEVRFIRQVLRKMGKHPMDEEEGDNDGIR